MYPKVKIFNPLSKDFSVTYDIKGDGDPVLYIIHAGEAETFEKPVADHIKDHLAKHIAQIKRGNGTYEDAYNAAVKEIEWKV